MNNQTVNETKDYTKKAIEILFNWDENFSGSEMKFLKEHLDEIDWVEVIQQLISQCYSMEGILTLNRLVILSEEDDIDFGKIFLKLLKEESFDSYYDFCDTSYIVDIISDPMILNNITDTKEYGRWVIRMIHRFYEFIFSK